MNTIPTTEGNKTIPEIIDYLMYASYRAQREYGMSHESAVRLGLGNDQFKEQYENEIKPQ